MALLGKTCFTATFPPSPPHSEGLGESSRFLKAVHFFLTELATRDLSAAERRFQLGKGTSHFSPREMDQYNFSKCTITVRLLEFSTMVLTRGDQDLLKVELDSDDGRVLSVEHADVSLLRSFWKKTCLSRRFSSW